MVRRAYSRPCRFFRDNGTVSRVAWQEALPNAPDLGEWSVILSKYLEPDDWLDDGPGEVADSPRTTTLATAPAGLPYTHVCGVPADFDQGCVRDPSLPPVQYGALGYPICCGAPKLTRGGAGVGGRVRLIRVPVAGLTCETAAPLELGETYLLSSPVIPGIDWYKVTVPAFHSTRVTVSFIPDGALLWVVQQQCAPFETIYVSTNLPNTFDLPINGQVIFSVSTSTVPTPYTVLFEAVPI